MGNGKKIPASLAGDEITAYLNMMEPTRPVIVEACTEKMQARELLPLTTSSPDANPVTFFSKNVNAFVFDKDLINRFFDENGPNGQQKPADVLLVFLGMVKEDEDDAKNIGTPTVVLAGCYQNNDGTFSSMNLPGEEATEFPPKRIVRMFPNKLKEMVQEISQGKDEHLVEAFKAEVGKHIPLQFEIVQEQ
jgi:hypothetical protein